MKFKFDGVGQLSWLLWPHDSTSAPVHDNHDGNGHDYDICLPRSESTRPLWTEIFGRDASQSV